ncbi:DUF3164 family protein [Flavobacterium sp. GA093]|uniref:DUF3164 family protein n=1 Tax=Flavobacterium hydrocarbonoxydans TaxID=2683249 RepID=A0A6I4NPI8_9FLAO|nr:DUF3164 family protein [Flavobacterium hydrocarbonoxydans]MWB92957.1 DUF3164 family protein [Flavobacterium hydrocarbonoxydans]
MNAETNTESIDLTKFSPEQLKAALAKVESKKDNDRLAYKQLVEQTVPQAIFTLCAASEMISNAKTKAFKYFEDVLKLKADVFGIKEKQQSHTFSYKNGEITIGYRVTDGWDDTVSAGIAKVEKYISSLATNESTASLVNIVFNLLKKDAKGNLKGSRVLELQKLTKEINDEEFTDGVNIISESYKPVRSVWYVEATHIDDDGTRTPIPLSASSVDFSQGYKFDFYSEPVKS